MRGCSIYAAEPATCCWRWRLARGRPLLASDFCHPMLVEARRKIGGRGFRTPVFEADALALPLAGASLDLITVAFGFRNLANYQRGLEEMLRVLKPGGVAAILEFSQPPNPAFRALYGFFSTRVLPAHRRNDLGLAAMRIRTCPNPSVNFPARKSSPQDMRARRFFARRIRAHDRRRRSAASWRQITAA